MLTLNRLLLYILLLLIISNVKAQQLWSDATTWPGGIKPQAMQNVTIPMGTTIILDEDPPVLGGITILGTLEFARKNTNLTCAWMMVHGTLQIGTPQQPFTHKAIITLNGEVNENVMGMGSRGIMVMGGKLELHGATEGL
ncbi:MAG: G8 domain-containing protein, partial [Chitinophagaceae bacterium]